MAFPEASDTSLSADIPPISTPTRFLFIPFLATIFKSVFTLGFQVLN
jgi:hypothetical protein